METDGWGFESSYPLVCTLLCLSAHSLTAKRRQMTRVEIRGSNPLVRMYWLPVAAFWDTPFK